MQRDSDLVNAVHEHWVLSGVDVDDADTMAEELADHLSSALADGKSVEAVVGGNLRDFADRWAEPIVEPASLWSRMRLVLVGAASFATAYVGVGAGLDLGSPVTVEPIETGIAAIFGGFIGLLLFSPTTSRLSPKGGLRSGRGLAILVLLMGMILLGGWIALASAFEEAWTFEVPAWLAVVAALYAFVIFISPLMVGIARIDRTDGWTKKILQVVDKFF